MNTCPYDPKELSGKPIGMFHCPICSNMVIAGMEHPDYSPEAEAERDRQVAEEAERAGWKMSKP